MTTDGSNWDRVSAAHQKRYGFDGSDVNYGPWSPPESKLNLLGKVHGRRVLDAGCGGGQNAIALARRGAVVTGIDSSALQLSAARMLATATGMDVSFYQTAVEDMSILPASNWDLILANFLFSYVADVERALQECVRVLESRGRLVFALDHPIRACFHDNEDGALSILPLRDYFDSSPLVWTFDDTDVAMQSRHRTIGQWSALLSACGLNLQRIIEPRPPQELLDELWPEDGALSPLRLLPQAIIFVAVKPVQ